MIEQVTEAIIATNERLSWAEAHDIARAAIEAMHIPKEDSAFLEHLAVELCEQLSDWESSDELCIAFSRRIVCWIRAK